MRKGLTNMVVEYQSYEFKKSEEETAMNNDSGVGTGRENMLT